MQDTTKPFNCRTEVRLVPGKGRGVFALEDIGNGSTVECAPALKVPKNDQGLIRATFLVNYLFCDDEDETQDLLALGHASLYNHSFHPNAVWATGNGMIFIIAGRKINKGEEILIDYGWEDQDYVEAGIK